MPFPNLHKNTLCTRAATSARCFGGALSPYLPLPSSPDSVFPEVWDEDYGRVGFSEVLRMDSSYCLSQMVRQLLPVQFPLELSTRDQVSVWRLSHTHCPLLPAESRPQPLAFHRQAALARISSHYFICVAFIVTVAIYLWQVILAFHL